MTLQCCCWPILSHVQAVDFCVPSELGYTSRTAAPQLRMAPEHARFYTHWMLAALLCCHGNSIVQGDCKPQNVLVREDGTLALCDFGHAHFGFNATQPQLTEPVHELSGTEEYMAPEVAALRRAFQHMDEMRAAGVESIALQRPDLACVWSLLGVTLLQLLLGPDQGSLHAMYFTSAVTWREQCGLHALVQRQPPPTPSGNISPRLPRGQLPDDLLDMLEKCVLVPSDKRWSAERLAGHAYFAGMDVAALSCQPIPAQHLDALREFQY
jgi:serine/threonine protein kinase